jgi:hypothetical protein
MNWKESINNRLRGAYQFFYELRVSTPQDAKAQTAALKKFMDLAGIPLNKVSDVISKTQFAQRYRQEAGAMPDEIPNPEAWGEEIGEKLYQELMGVNNE